MDSTVAGPPPGSQSRTTTVSTLSLFALVADQAWSTPRPSCTTKLVPAKETPRAWMPGATTACSVSSWGA
nr:hypothetical protein [Blastococcus aurantiacus]